jgi:hypothetical protein
MEKDIPMAEKLINNSTKTGGVNVSVMSTR